MIMYEQDPDVVRWGLHLLDICRIPSGGSPGSSIHYEKDLSQVECVKEGYCETKCDEVENDEIIAHALQEELSRLAAAEASGSSQAGEEDLQASILSQDWRVPSNRHFTVEHGGDHRDTDERGNSGSCSSLGEESNFVESQPYSPEIANESVLDGEVGKRLNQMVPVPHVPKINGDLPSADEEMSDHQRLLERLRLYDLVELKVQGDGNCQFRALSDQIYRTTEHHKLVREQVVGQLKSLPELYEGYVPMAYDHYLQNISKTGEWGDHVTLQAAADTVLV
ncbi:OVARIAN TUMOR DOMAIN-containing deubiquitinating enzyme 9 isoform X2 [Rhododendron vialii]|uniref:OVARIAN TUMOR DOMAIN-containing deubiquitinating enzyme 9 isoform X2 n=1 Tax=Rhododendron vialii TaxID=182163 RepID=UPI00265E20EA|nr:OVARIAN TUMOR DOMAIN-containing deubiquitinating enzyme 9 isoform X2 [Rhododendron vialii]